MFFPISLWAHCNLLLVFPYKLVLKLSWNIRNQHLNTSGSPQSCPTCSNISSWFSLPSVTPTAALQNVGRSRDHSRFGQNYFIPTRCLQRHSYDKLIMVTNKFWNWAFGKEKGSINGEITVIKRYSARCVRLVHMQISLMILGTIAYGSWCKVTQHPSAEYIIRNWF